jgi:hypothetical protein
MGLCNREPGLINSPVPSNREYVATVDPQDRRAGCGKDLWAKNGTSRI